MLHRLISRFVSLPIGNIREFPTPSTWHTGFKRLQLAWQLALMVLCTPRALQHQVHQETGLKTLAAGGADVMLNVTVKEFKPGAVFVADGVCICGNSRLIHGD